MEQLIEAHSRKGFPSLKAAALLLPPAAAYCVLAALFPAQTTSIVTFAGFFAVFLLLPSLALGMLMLPGERSLPESMFLGYPPAQMLLFLLIFAGAGLRTIWLPALLPTASVVALIVLGRKGRLRSAPAMESQAFWLTFGAAALAIGLCFLKIVNYPLPTPGHPAQYFQDDTGTAAFVWAGANAIAYGVSYALPWVSGFTDYPYHRIYHFTYGYVTAAFGVSPMEQILFLWAPAQWMMLCGAVVAGCRRLAGFSNLETALALLLLLFSDGIDFNAQTSIQTISYYHTFFYGFPAFLLILLSCYGYFGERRKIAPAYAAACFFVAAGVKANLLLFLPLSLLPVILYRLARRMDVKRDVKLMVYSFISACVLFFTHFDNPALNQARTKSFHLWGLLMGTLGNLITMTITVGPFLLLLAFAADRDQLLRERLRRDGQYFLFLLTFCVASAIFLKAVNYLGGESYFYWQARLMTLVAIVWLAAHALRWRDKVITPLVACVLVAGIYCFGANIWATRGDPSEGPGKYDPKFPAAKNIDEGEYEGLRWVSTHLNRTKTFITNKDAYLGLYIGGFIRMYTPDYLGFCGMQGYASENTQFGVEVQEAIAARRVWIDKFLGDGDREEREQALAHIGADYFIYGERLAPGAYAGFPGLRPVYHNTSITVYEIVRQTAGDAAAGPGAQPTRPAGRIS